MNMLHMAWCTIECSWITGTERLSLSCTTGAAMQQTCWYRFLQIFTQPSLIFHLVQFLEHLLAHDCLPFLVLDCVLACYYYPVLNHLHHMYSASFISTILFWILGSISCPSHSTPNVKSKEMHWLNALIQVQQKRKQVSTQRTHWCVLHASSMDCLICASDCCHPHNADSQNDVL